MFLLILFVSKRGFNITTDLLKGNNLREGLGLFLVIINSGIGFVEPLFLSVILIVSYLGFMESNIRSIFP